MKKRKYTKAVKNGSADSATTNNHDWGYVVPMKGGKTLNASLPSKGPNIALIEQDMDDHIVWSDRGMS